MPTTCPECGAYLNDGTTCQSIFDSFLVLEFTDPDYGKVHMLTVTCFMIQHGRYSDEALIWIEDKLRDYLEDGTPIEQIRKHAGRGAGQDTRTWKVTRQPGTPPPSKVSWSITIADIASNYQDAGSYCKLVTQWARITLQEMKPLTHLLL